MAGIYESLRWEGRRSGWFNDKRPLLNRNFNGSQFKAQAVVCKIAALSKHSQQALAGDGGPDSGMIYDMTTRVIIYTYSFLL